MKLVAAGILCLALAACETSTNKAGTVTVTKADLAAINAVGALVLRGAEIALEAQRQQAVRAAAQDAKTIKPVSAR